MSFLAKFAASKYVGEKLEENFGPENPKYDILITENGRRKKIKKPFPQGLSVHDERVLKTVRRKAWRYEWWVDCHCFCGTHIQFGTVTLWGLLPFIGDFIALLKALALIDAARKVQGGLPPHLVLTMLVWSAIDFAIKLVPFLGDILTAIIKPNTRNAMRVEAFLTARAAKNLRGGGGGGGGDGAVVVTVPVGGSSVQSPLLVSQQPSVQRGMTAGTGGAGPSYGTVHTTTSTADAEGRSRGRKILPFWRRNEESDSEDEEVVIRQ